MQDPMMLSNLMGYPQNFDNNQSPVEQVAIKKLPNPQNYKIVKCKNFEMGIIFLFNWHNYFLGNCKYKNLCTFAHGEAELRTKNENSFLSTNQTENNFNNNNSNNNNNTNFMQQMYNPYAQMNDMSAYQGYNNNPVWNGDFNQMYNFQNLPNNLNENGMINPNSINLNVNMMDMNSIDPNMLIFLQQQNRNIQN